MENINSQNINTETLKEGFAKAASRNKIAAFIFTAIAVGAAALVAAKIATIAFTIITILALVFAGFCVYNLCTGEGKLKKSIEAANMLTLFNTPYVTHNSYTTNDTEN